MARVEKAHVYFQTHVDHAERVEIKLYTAPWGGLKDDEHSLSIVILCEVDVNITMTRTQLELLGFVIDSHLRELDRKKEEVLTNQQE